MVREFHLVSVYSCHRRGWHPRVKSFDDFYTFFKILPCSPFPVVRHSPNFPYTMAYGLKACSCHPLRLAIWTYHVARCVLKTRCYKYSECTSLYSLYWYNKICVCNYAMVYYTDWANYCTESCRDMEAELNDCTQEIHCKLQTFKFNVNRCNFALQTWEHELRWDENYFFFELDLSTPNSPNLLRSYNWVFLSHRP